MSAPAEISLLQALKLKGRASPEKVAPAICARVEEVDRGFAALVAAGLVAHGSGGLKLEAAGVERLAALLDHERAQVDAEALVDLYADFRTLDLELKQTLTAWQMRDERTPNDHMDRSYDARVLRRLARLHECVASLAARLSSLVPRLSPYAARLGAAHQRLAGGAHEFIASPLVDSYHTIWFELHEELLGLTGNERTPESQ